MRRYPIHLAYHYLGCVAEAPDGLMVPGIHGPLIEGYADLVDRVSVVAWDRPSGDVGAEDRTEYPLTSRGNVAALSLGPKGTWKHARARKRRVGAIVAEASKEWDVLALRLPNRRVAEVSGASVCPRLVCIDGSNVIDEAPHIDIPPLAKARRAVAVAVSERETRKVLDASGLVFVNSELLARRHRTIASELAIVPWSLRKSEYAFVREDRLSDLSPNVLIAGRITAAKGVLDALLAFCLLKQGLGNAHLHVVGDGDAIEEMRRTVEDEGLVSSVTFHGWIPMGEELFARFRQMDVLLHLSHAESFPRVVWDALAHSVLVVCTPVGGLPHALDDGGEVLFVPVSDPPAAARAVARLAGDRALRRKLLTAGYARARDTDIGHVTEVMLERMTERWPDLRDVGGSRGAGA